MARHRSIRFQVWNCIIDWLVWLKAKKDIWWHGFYFCFVLLMCNVLVRNEKKERKGKRNVMIPLERMCVSVSGHGMAWDAVKEDRKRQRWVEFSVQCSEFRVQSWAELPLFTLQFSLSPQSFNFNRTFI